MKIKLLIAAFLLVGTAPAHANDQGAWVKVDANGNAVGGAIVCTSDVCGDKNSPYAKATLGAGEQYVLQAKANPITNNVVGVGNNTPGVQAKVDLPTNTWTVTHTQVTQSPAHPVTNETVKVTNTTVQTFNPIDPPKPLFETSTVVAKIEPTTIKTTTIERKIITDMSDPEFDWVIWWENWIKEWDFFGNWYLGLFDWWTL
jgi:hypothetical protein